MARKTAVPRRILQHGVDRSGALIAIEEVERGRTALACPYCATRLIAKKGQVLAPHFAHDGDTCRDSHERTAAYVPFYSDFETLEPLGRADLRLCAQLLGRTINHTSIRGWRRAALTRLVDSRLIEDVPRGERWVNGIGSHRHTEWGQLISRAVRRRLTLSDLARVQERAALEKLDRLEMAAHTGGEREGMDVRLYRAQLARLFSLDLYLLRVRADGSELHKIGVTSRPLEERLAEIRRDLANHFRDVELEVEGHWLNRGSLEHYFKCVFSRRQAQIGTLTEYFSFEGYRRPFTQLAKLPPHLSPRLQTLL